MFNRRKSIIEKMQEWQKTLNAKEQELQTRKQKLRNDGVMINPVHSSYLGRKTAYDHLKEQETRLKIEEQQIQILEQTASKNNEATPYYNFN